MYRKSLASVPWPGPWQVMSTFDEIEDMWHFFKSSLFCVLDEHAPLRLVVSKFSKRPTPWMTSELLQAIKEKDKAKRRAAKTKDTADIVLYRKFKNKLKTSIHEAKLYYLTVLLKKSKSNPHLSSSLWNSMNNIIGWSKPYQNGIGSNVSLESVNEFFVKSPLIIGQLINMYHQLFPVLAPFILHPFILIQCCTCCSILILRNPLALMEFQQGS